MEQGDEGREKGNSRDKRFGAVDWVEHPDKFCVFALTAIFLTNDAVFWVAGGQYLADAFFCVPVGQRDWSGVGFALDFHVGAVMGHDLFGGFIAEIGDEFDEFVFLCSGQFRHLQSVVCGKFVLKLGLPLKRGKLRLIGHRATPFASTWAGLVVGRRPRWRMIATVSICVVAMRRHSRRRGLGSAFGRRPCWRMIAMVSICVVAMRRQSRRRGRGRWRFQALTKIVAQSVCLSPSLSPKLRTWKKDV